jgi:hypothetical protein
MQHSLATVVFIVLLAGATWYSLSHTMDDLTRRDCQAGVVAACEAMAGSK